MWFTMHPPSPSHTKDGDHRREGENKNKKASETKPITTITAMPSEHESEDDRE